VHTEDFTIQLMLDPHPETAALQWAQLLQKMPQDPGQRSAKNFIDHVTSPTALEESISNISTKYASSYCPRLPDSA